MSERTDVYRDWLGAYADGELNLERRAWLEDHLANCQTCQQELRELRALSALLHADPLPVAAADVSINAAQVLARLPHPQPPFGQRMLRSGLRYLPLGLFGVYAFFQAVILVSAGLLLTLNWLPGGASLAALLPSVAPSGEGALTNLLGLAVRSARLDALFEPVTGWLAQLSWAIPLGLLNLVLLFLLGAFFCTWLAVLWSRHHRLQSRE